MWSLKWWAAKGGTFGNEIILQRKQEHHKQRNKNKVSTVVDVSRVEVNTSYQEHLCLNLLNQPLSPPIVPTPPYWYKIHGLCTYLHISLLSVTNYLQCKLQIIFVKWVVEPVGCPIIEKLHGIAILPTKSLVSGLWASLTYIVSVCTGVVQW